MKLFLMSEITVSVTTLLLTLAHYLFGKRKSNLSITHIHAYDQVIAGNQVYLDGLHYE